MTDAQAPDLRSRVAGLFAAALKTVAPDAAASIVLERPKLAAHGDFSCNVAMQLAKLLRTKPRDVAQQILAALPASELVAKAEIAGAGFINIFLQDAVKQ